MKKVKKDEKMNPKKIKRPWKCASQNSTTIYFLYKINDYVQFVTYATIHDSQNVQTWLFHVFNFMLIVREWKSDQTV